MAIRCYRSLIIIVIAFSMHATADLISKRHSTNLEALDPDDPKFELIALSKGYYKELKKADGKEAAWPEEENPFEDEPRCRRRDEFRSIDGTCNNLRDPFLGASKTPLDRLVPVNRYEDGIDSPTATFFTSSELLPTARTVSLAVHETITNISTRHSHLLAGFGQFTDHDISLSPEAEPEDEEADPKELCCKTDPSEWKGDLEECFPLLTPNDLIFQRTCIPFFRSAPTPGFPGDRVERFNLNDLTSFIDASQVYGSTNDIANRLRLFQNGLLRASPGLNDEEGLPASDENPPNCFVGEVECEFFAGDIRSSEQAGLSSLHTLFLREHNRIAREIQELNPDQEDEFVYQTTRKILGAIMQRITYREFLPEVVGPRVMRRKRLTLREDGRRDNRYNEDLDPRVLNEFSTAAFRFGHSLIREDFAIDNLGKKTVDLGFLFSAFISVSKVGNDALLTGLTSVNMESRERFVTNNLRNELFDMELDLPAFNIQRSRDHGLASYNEVREELGLRVFDNFDQLIGRTHSIEAVNALREVYPTVGDMELFPAGLSEISVEGGIVGETFANVIGEQFRRLKFGDRFWHETRRRNIRFTDEQLEQIRTVSLASIFCQNVPGVTVRPLLLLTTLPENPATSCAAIPNMDFEPWRS